MTRREWRVLNNEIERVKRTLDDATLAGASSDTIAGFAIKLDTLRWVKDQMTIAKFRQ